MESVGNTPCSSDPQLATGDNDSDTALISEKTIRRTPPGHGWMGTFTIIILCYVNLINYMDRFTLAGVLTEVKTHFNIGDDQGGLLQTMFVVSYMVFAPVFGYMGDRYSRRWIMVVGVTLWSLTTLAGSFMEDFKWFIAFRALVGIGEASYSTIAPTIISDLFVKEQRSKMLALFYFAIPVGSGLGYIVGAEAALAGGSWRWALRVTPLLGMIAVGLIIWPLQEPIRGEAECSVSMETTTYKQDIIILSKNKSFMLSTAGFTCVAFVAGALAWWGPHFVYLGHKLHADGHADMGTTTLIFGVIGMMAGIIGVPLGTGLGQLLLKKWPQAHPLVCAAGLFISAPFMVAAIFLLKTSIVLPYIFVFLGQVALNLNWAIVADILLYVVVPTRRSTAEAFQILVSHTFGDAGSPYLVGLISELLKPMINSRLGPIDGDGPASNEDVVDFTSLQYAIFVTCFIEILGGVFFLLTSLYIVGDKEKMQKEIADSEEEHR